MYQELLGERAARPEGGRRRRGPEPHVGGEGTISSRLIQDGVILCRKGYGAFLNANRGYMLTRSQPPFLTSMIMAVYDAEKAKGHDDREWLETAYPYAVKDHDLWVHEPHLAGATGLSRYFDFGEGPVAEEDPTYYRRAAGYFILHPGEAAGFLSTTRARRASAESHRAPVLT